MESSIDSRTVKLEPDLAALIVAAPDFAQGRQLLAPFQGRLRSGRSEDDADMVAAGTVDRVPQDANFVRRHPVLRIQENHGVDLARREAVEELAQIAVNRDDQTRVIAHPCKSILL